MKRIHLFICLCFVFSLRMQALDFPDKTVEKTVMLGDVFNINPASDLGMTDETIMNNCYDVTCDSYNSTAFDVTEQESSTDYYWRTGTFSDVLRGHYSIFTITTKKKGNYSIVTTVTYMYNNYGTGASNKSSTVTYNVHVLTVESITLAPSPLELKEGSTYPLSYSISPAGATSTLTWSSSNKNIATVDQNGFVTAKNAGTATITCTASNGVKGTCTVIVSANTIAVSSITLNQTNLEIVSGDTYLLTATITPSNATNKDVTWSSNNNSIATVNSNGLVTGVGVGNAIITCQAQDGSGVMATCNITVNAATVLINQITLDIQNKEISQGQTFQLSATVSPSNATNKNVTWSSNNSSVATVNSNGLVTGVGVGNAVITCQALDGSGVKATCNITVNAATVLVTQITLNATNKEISQGQTFQLSATVSPSNATNKNVTWSSNNTSVATVNSNGLVTGVGVGNAVITCEAQDGSGVKTTCNVTIKVLATEITLNASNIVLTVGQTFQLTCTVVPSNATYDSLKWSSDNNSVATVTQFVPSSSITDGGCIFFVEGNPGGLVTAHAPGSATITCLIQDGSGVTATCNVTVKESTEDIIQFADAEVKSICVEHWDTDGDGELSYEEAAAVTSIETVFRDNKTIGSFAELEYFTGLTTINDWAFGSCSSLRTITFPSSLTSIGSFIFYGSKALTSITIPKSVTSIGDEMLVYTEGLGSIIVENGNTVYDSRNGCNAIIKTATNTLIAGCMNSTIPNSVTGIGKKAFALCSNLANISIPSSVKSIGEYAFQQCKSLSSITLPSGITRIEQGTFYVCSSLVTANIPNGVTVIGDRAFWGCGFINIELPTTLKTLSSSAFYQCKSLTSVDIPEGVTSIGSYAFGFCDALSSISIPKSVTSISQYAFRFCPSLTEVTSYINPPFNITDDVFEVYDDNYNIVFTPATLYVPTGTKTKYQAAAGWMNFQNIVEMGADVVSGDANGDGTANVTDYMAIANYILGLNPSSFNAAAADVNGDNDVNVTDYVGVANIILYGNYQGPSVSSIIAFGTDETLPWMEIGVTEDGKMNLLVHDTKPFSAFQMDIRLPEGVEIIDAYMAKANQTKNLGFAKLQDGTWRLLYGTLDNKTVNLVGDNLLTLELASSQPNVGGFVIVDDIFVTDRYASTLQLNAVQSGLPTGINSIKRGTLVDGDSYDLTGRKVNNGQLKKGVYVVNGKKLFVK